ncbi:MAG: family 16 glycosylhydrolase [Saprospiraceae bacterium]
MSANNSQSTHQDEDNYTPGSNWKLAWSDEFKSATLDTKTWNRQVEKAGRFNEEWQRYTDSTDNAYIENNCLVLKAMHEGNEHAMDHYTSARLNTAGKMTFKYGKIAAKMKLPYSQGIWPAFWMLGANIDENGGDTPWPQCGEIDILELYGSKNDSIVECNLHYANAENKHTMMGAADYHLKDGKFADDFHVFELEWDENKISWLVDGEQYATTSIATEDRSEFRNEFFLLLNIAVGGTYADYPDEMTVFPQYMYVDWIRIYEKV